MGKLSQLRATQWKHIAFLTGLPSAGTKAELETCIRAHLRDAPTGPVGQRIVSVDMGIRNLAFCVLDKTDRGVGVQAWRRLDLLQKLPSRKHAATEVDPEAISTRGRAKAQKPTEATELAKDAFTPTVLAPVAYGIARELLNYRPSMVLIERQRFRSSGGSAIQEWTVRVNMLESMLYACFATLQLSGKSTEDRLPHPEVLGVSPARVAKFWTAGVNTPLEPPVDLLSIPSQTSESSTTGESTRRKVTKNEKIAALKELISPSSSPPIIFMNEATESIAEGLRAGKLLKISDDGGSNLGKLDDLTDCMLQGLAWLKWEENRGKLSQLLADDHFPPSH